MDWLDLLAAQGTLKCLLQHHSSKASILRRSAFFTVQLSHPYMTTGKIIALTRWTFVGKTYIYLIRTDTCSIEPVVMELISVNQNVSTPPSRWICRLPVLKNSIPHHSRTSASLGLVYLSLEMFFLVLFLFVFPITSFCNGNTSDSSSCLYREPRHTRKGPLWISLSGNSQEWFFTSWLV